MSLKNIVRIGKGINIRGFMDRSKMNVLRRRTRILVFSQDYFSSKHALVFVPIIAPNILPLVGDLDAQNFLPALNPSADEAQSFI